MALAGKHLSCLVASVLLRAALGASGPNCIYTEAPRYDAAAPASGAERFPAGAALKIVSAGRVLPLAPGFVASADACVSFDARRVLFAGRRTSGDRWQIWEVTLAGGAPRRVVAAGTDLIRPLYLPGDRIVYAVRTGGGFQLESARTDGTGKMRLTFAPGNFVGCDVLRDGRILFEGPHPAAAGRDLYAVYSDGSGVETIRCDHGADRHAGRQLSSGDIVFEAASRLWRFTSALARAVPLETPGGEFAGPVAEIAGSWLVSHRGGPGGRFALMRWARGRGAMEQVAAPARAHAVQPVAVAPRPVPPRHPSALGDREGANLLCLSVYTSRAPAPQGTVAAVRVWSRDDAGVPAALGEAPVAADGSFFVQVPGEKPIRFELLDRAGKTVSAEHGWFWGRRGEQRVCVGCHAGPEHAPDNVAPAVLQSPQPVKLNTPVHVTAGGLR